MGDIDTFQMRAAFVQAQAQIMNDGNYEPVVVISKPLALSLLDEIERLQRWKAESMTLLKQWNQIADDVIARLDADDTLGLRLPDIVASELARLCAERDAERYLADQLASHLEWALRCVGSLPMEMRMTFDNRMAEVLAAHKGARRAQ